MSGGSTFQKSSSPFRPGCPDKCPMYSPSMEYASTSSASEIRMPSGTSVGSGRQGQLPCGTRVAHHLHQIPTRLCPYCSIPGSSLRAASLRSLTRDTNIRRPNHGPATQDHRDAATSLVAGFAQRIEGGFDKGLLDAIAPGDGSCRSADCAVTLRRLFRVEVVFVNFSCKSVFYGAVFKLVPPTNRPEVQLIPREHSGFAVRNKGVADRPVLRQVLCAGLAVQRALQSTMTPMEDSPAQKLGRFNVQNLDSVIAL